MQTIVIDTHYETCVWFSQCCASSTPTNGSVY